MRKGTVAMCDCFPLRFPLCFILLIKFYHSVHGAAGKFRKGNLSFQGTRATAPGSEKEGQTDLRVSWISVFTFFHSIFLKGEN